MQSGHGVRSRRRKPRKPKAYFWCAAALAWSPGASAQQPASTGTPQPGDFVLDAGSCPTELTVDLERLVRIELESGKYEHPDDIEIHVECDESEITLSVTGRDRAPGAKRRVDLSHTAESVHARVLALAIAELLRERDARPARPARPAARPKAPPALPRPSKPPPPPPPPPQPEAPVPLGKLEAFFALSQFDFSNEVGLGGGVRFWYERLAPWHLALDFSATTLERDVELGSARIVSASLGARFGYTLRMAEWALRFGAGQRSGFARVSGNSSDPALTAEGSVIGAFTTTLGYFALDSEIGGAVRAGLGAELGGVLVPVRGRIQNEADFGVDGIWTALEVGLSLEF